MSSSLSPTPRAEAVTDSMVGSDSGLSPKASASARWKWLLRLALGFIILVFLIGRGEDAFAPGAPLRRAFSMVSFPVLLGSVAFYLAGQVLSAWKWQLLLRAQGARISLLDCCRFYWLGMFWNLWMPTNVGGDGVRAYLAGKRCGTTLSAASSVFVERVTGLLALMFIGATGLIAAATQKPENATNQNAAWRLLLICLAGVFVLVGLWLGTRRMSLRPKDEGVQGKFARKLAGLHRALDVYAHPEQRGVLMVALGLSLLFQASQVALNVFLARTIGLDLPVLTFCWLVPMLALASLVPLGLGGLGVREAAALVLLGTHQAAPGTILAWSLLWQATVWLSSLPGGVFLLTRTGKSTM